MWTGTSPQLARTVTPSTLPFLYIYLFGLGQCFYEFYSACLQSKSGKSLPSGDTRFIYYIVFGKIANICCVVNNLGNESWSSFVGKFYIFHIIDRPISYISTRCVYVCGIYSFLHMCWFPATNYMLCYNGRLYFSVKTTLCLILLNGFLVVDFT